MDRKLHNTLMAIIASTSLLALGLIVGTPAMPSLDAAAAPDAFASVNEEPAFPEASSDAGKSDLGTSQASRRAASGKRQSVSMPFFSFVPRG